MKIHADNRFKINPSMAETAATYVQTVLNNLDSDDRMKKFLSYDEKDVLKEAISILNDISDAVRNPDNWNI